MSRRAPCRRALPTDGGEALNAAPAPAPEPSSDAHSLPLAGFTVGVTAARRAEELTGLLQRRGARVVEAPAIRIIPTSDDVDLRAATLACMEIGPDVVVATTGIGFRGWIEAADGWGLGEQLRERLAQSQLLARGPKAKGAVRAAGLAEHWSPESEASDEVLERLLAEGVSGRRVVVQQHGEPLTSFTTALRRAGAEVVEVPVYRWVPADDIAPLRRLVASAVAGQVDCLTFTSAPAVASMLQVAEQDGRTQGLVEALSGRVMAACVGPVTAAPLERLGITTVQPARARLGALVRTVVEELPRRHVRTAEAGSHLLELRGHAVYVDGRRAELTPRQVGVLAALLDRGGRVMSRPELLQTVWRNEPADEHAVEMTVARLRTALGAAGVVVETVVKRGYRLAAAD